MDKITTYRELRLTSLEIICSAGKRLLMVFNAIATLVIGGFIVFPMLSIIGIIYTTSKHLYKLDYSLSKQLNPILRSLTLASDGFACAAAGELLNDTLEVKGKIRYGKWYKTISGITGSRLLFEKQDNKFRTIIDKTLGKDHCTESITEEDYYYYDNHRQQKF